MIIFTMILMNFKVILFVLPLFLIPLQAQEFVEVRVGTNVRLECKPSSNVPTIPTTYQWIDPRGRVMGSNENLIIENFSYENQGVYTCKASQMINGQIASSEKSIQVRIKGEIQSIQVNVPETYNTFATGIIYLSCKTTDSDTSKYKFEWITPTGEKQPTSSLFKNQVLLNEAGYYTCRVTRLSDNVFSEGRTLITINQLPLKIEKVSGNLRMDETIRMNCEVDVPKTEKKVFTQYSYTWTDPNNRVISNTAILELKLDNPSKFGLYQCKITALGMRSPYVQTQSVELRYSGDINSGGKNGGRNGGERPTVTYTASFSSSPKVVRFFDPLILTCGVTPPLAGVSYQIFFNNEPLTTSSTYSIPRLGKANLGTYQCTVSGRDQNSGQQVDIKATFTIQPEYKTGSKIELTDPPGPQMFVRAGDKRELHCEIEPNSGLRGRDAQWYFNGREISQTDLGQYNLQILPRLYVSMLVVKSAQTKNEGKYECKVRGETKEAYIIVMSRSKSIEVNPTDEVRREGDGRAVEFHCRIDNYRTKNKDVIWTFISKETGQITSLDSRWTRLDDTTADETSFIVLQQAEVRDTGTYVCTEPQTRDTARGVLTVTSDMRIVVTPPIVKLRAGESATFQCILLNAGRSPDYPDFYMANGGRASDSQRTTVEKLEAGKVQLTYRAVTTNDNGTKFTCRKGRSTADALILVEPVCTAGFRLCRNSECINSAKFCDGKLDCSDGSDEDQQFCRQCDPLSKRCEVHNGLPPTNSIYQAHWACDGEDDCGNGYDESRCSGNVLECGGLTYRCTDGTKSIPKAFVCDKDTDCTNGDDESNCVMPTIIPEPTDSYKINARKGETVVLSCHIRGFPLPKIVWRFNWGCLTDDRRMTVVESYRNCESTYSTLTISNFQPGDDGIYNCEGLSGGKRAWSRDYQLLMNFRQ